MKVQHLTFTHRVAFLGSISSHDAYWIIQLFVFSSPLLSWSKREWSLFGHLTQLQEHNYVHVSSAFTHWQVLPCEHYSSMQYRYLRFRTSFGAASFCTWHVLVCCPLAAIHCYQDYKELVLLQDGGSIKPPLYLMVYCWKVPSVGGKRDVGLSLLHAQL